MITSAQLLQAGQDHLFQTYQRPPMVIIRGEGSWLFDADGRRYLDLAGGISVTALGHAHPRLAEAIAKQAQTVGHLSSLYYNDKSNLLAEAICSRSFGQRVFFSNSGAEANEGSIKMARRHFYNRKEPRFEVISALNSFHGRTFGALAATGQAKYHEGFSPLPEGFKYVPYGNIEALSRAITGQTALVMLEPMQGEGGVVIPPVGYLAAVRQLCSERGVLLHFDEVQVGMGRTGKWFCHEHESVIPDSMSLAKSLGGGLPLAALVATQELASNLVPGSHASTFGGNPISCAAALAFIEVVEAEGLLERCHEVGERTLSYLRSSLQGVEWVNEVRGRGCLIGIDLKVSARPLVLQARERFVLSTVAADNVLRIAPAFNIPFDVLEQALKVLVDVIKEGHKA